MDNQSKNIQVFKVKPFLFSCLLSLLFLVVSLILNYFVAIYADNNVSNPVTDIFLSNIKVFDVDLLFIYGPVFFWFFIFILSFKYVKRVPFLVYSIGLFTVIRSIFVSLTHIAPFPTHSLITSTNIIAQFSAGNDLFFSGHTGLPFLVALIFWDIPWIRYICLASSVFFGIVVLLGHYHYSIDVLSAFFITYSIYKISEVLFKKEKQIFGFAK